MKKYDLHCHSTYSDGTYTPVELLRLAKESGLSGISITDHDTMGSYCEELFQEAKKLEIELLPGVEISCALDKVNIHVLGYGVDYSNSEFQEFLKDIQTRRKERNIKILEKLAEKEIVITSDEFYAFAKKKGLNVNSCLGRPLIALMLLERGFVPSFQGAFDQYLKDGGPCYVSWRKFSPQSVVDQIHRANGKAVLAHPHQIKNNAVLEKLKHISFDGVEDTCRFFSFRTKNFIKEMKKKGLILSKGSDFHGLIRPHVLLGSTYVLEDVFEKLK
jgi:3',5'-nucleoside bisphosphate phosphatase